MLPLKKKKKLYHYLLIGVDSFQNEKETEDEIRLS